VYNREVSTAVEQIKDKLDIVEVLSSYIKLLKAGSTWKARCPFHGEKTPSFVVSPTRQSYHCFGCGEHGDIFTFVEKMEGTDFKGALKTLAERAGVQLVFDGKKGPTKDEKDALHDVLEAATQWYMRERLRSTEIQAYLKKRGLTDESIEGFKIGFAPDGWRHIHDALLPSHSLLQLEQAGLVVKGEKGAYDRFRSRIMFPLFDSVGRVVGFSGRIWNGDEKEAKYVNTPETVLFHKSKFLYGFDRAKTGIRKFNCTLLVEGQMDLIACHQVGYSNAVALSGTALTEEHAQLLGRISKNIIIALDGDGAGIAAAIKSARLSLQHGFDVKVARFIGGKDASAIVEQGGADALKEIIRNATFVVDFLTQILKERSEGDPRIFGRLIEAELFPVIADIQSPVEREHTLRSLATTAGVSYESLAASFRERAAHREKESNAHAQQNTQRVPVQKHDPFTSLTVFVSWLQRLQDARYAAFLDSVFSAKLPPRDAVANEVAVVLEHEFETKLDPRHILEHGELLLRRAQLYALDVETKEAEAQLKSAQVGADEAFLMASLTKLEELRKKRSLLH
jgi:DNA primase